MKTKKRLQKVEELLTQLIDTDDGSLAKCEHDELFSMRCRIEEMIEDSEVES